MKNNVVKVVLAVVGLLLVLLFGISGIVHASNPTGKTETFGLSPVTRPSDALTYAVAEWTVVAKEAVHDSLGIQHYVTIQNDDGVRKQIRMSEDDYLYMDAGSTVYQSVVELSNTAHNFWVAFGEVAKYLLLAVLAVAILVGLFVGVGFLVSMS